MATGGGDWAAVGDAVRARLAELGMTQQELARRAGVSAATVRKVQHATASGFRTVTLAQVSEALEWPAGALLGVARGRRPPAKPPRKDDNRRTRRLARLAVQLSPRELRAVERLVEELTRGRPDRERTGS